jgi:hypothetical protein
METWAIITGDQRAFENACYIASTSRKNTVRCVKVDSIEAARSHTFTGLIHAWPPPANVDEIERAVKAATKPNG